MTDQQNPENKDNEPRKKKGSPLVLILIAGGSLLAAGAFFTPQGRKLLGLDKSQDAVQKEEKAFVEPEKFYYVSVPSLLVNLNTPDGRQRFLKLSLILQLTKQDDIKEVEKVLPRIVDQFQVYLRELRVDDLRGAEGIYRLREQLLARANAEAAPLKVHDILFKDMLVQ